MKLAEARKRSPARSRLIRNQARAFPCAMWQPSFLPGLCRQGQFVEFNEGLLPRWIMLVEKCHKALAVRRLQQMCHFMDEDIFEQVFRFLHEFRVQPDVAGEMVATAPAGFHALKKVSLHPDAESRFPLLDERRDDLVEQRLVPRVHRSEEHT